MQNLLVSSSVTMFCSVSSVSTSGDVGNSFDLRTDQIVAPIDTTIATKIRANSKGDSVIKLNDNGSTGSWVGAGTLGDAKLVGFGWLVGVGFVVITHGEFVGPGVSIVGS